MGIEIKLITLCLGLIFLFNILRSLRKNLFKPSYALLWILVSSFLISIPILEPVYKFIATDIIGISDARHIIYIVLIGFLIVFNFNITSKISLLTDQVQKLISIVAILENEIKKRNEE